MTVKFVIGAPYIYFSFNSVIKVSQGFNCYCFSGLESKPRVGEYYAMVYVVTAAFEELRQLLDTDTLDASVKKNVKMFFRSGWNYVDMIAINTFFIGAAMRIDTNWGEFLDIFVPFLNVKFCLPSFQIIYNIYARIFWVRNSNCYFASRKDLAFSWGDSFSKQKNN